MAQAMTDLPAVGEAPADASRAEVAILKAQLEVERAKKKSYKNKVNLQNEQLETLVEDAEATIGVAQEKIDERMSKLNKAAGYTAAGTVVGMVGNAAMLNPLGVVQELVGGLSKGYEQVAESRDWANVNAKMELLWGGRHAEAASVSDSNVDGLNVDLMELNERKIVRMLEKFPEEEVDDMLDLPPGTAARHVRNKAIEARLGARCSQRLQ